jgi:hypothetical protein
VVRWSVGSVLVAGGAVDVHGRQQGEDVGWSWNCHRAGLKLFCASYLYAPHIMSQAMYDDYLKNGDSRPDNYAVPASAT